MFYEEKLIHGALHFRTEPDGEWRIVPKTTLSRRVLPLEEEAEAEVIEYMSTLRKCRDYIRRVSEATFNTDHDYADYDLLEEVETALVKIMG